MSTYKIFDGTNWVDPCDCNVSIIDSSGTFKLLDPNNCVLKYFDGTGWCDITCPCECPDGQVLNILTNECELTTTVAATPSGGATYELGAGDMSTAYSSSGARLYEDISTKIFPLNGFSPTGFSSGYKVVDAAGTGTTVTIQQTSSNPIWDEDGSGTAGRLNMSSVWAYDPTPFPDGEWLTLRYCINITAEKQYVFGMAGDNQVKATINSTTFNGGGITNLVNLWASAFPGGAPLTGLQTGPFVFWHMFPITLPIGSHILELSGYNILSYRAFGAEIYDISETDMINNLMVPSLIVPTAIDPYIIFSTKDLVSVPPLLIPAPGAVITWSCDPGFTLSECNGAPSCTEVISTPCTEIPPPINLDIDDQINIWFDNSGSIETTEAPLLDLYANELKACLLPFYNNDPLIYADRVKLFNMFDINGVWDYSERFVKCLGTDRNFQRGVGTPGKVINLTFSDESSVYGYGDTRPFDPSGRTVQYDNDMVDCRANIAQSILDGYRIYGTAFRVTSDQDVSHGFRGLTRATLINVGVYTPPFNLNDYYTSNFNCNLDTLAAETPRYYRDQIVASLKALGITIPNCP
jgi:hypothetical protein